MKNRITAKILLPLVLAIWGLIGWKVYAAMQADESLPAETREPAMHTAADHSPDSMDLLFNYRDPFLGTVDKPEEKKQNEPLAASVKKQDVHPVPQTFSWPSLVYSGLVRRSADQKTVGFLSVNGQVYFVSPGEIIGEIKVQQLWKDSVLIVSGKERKIFRR